jgi:flagellar protein FliO/FliZ
VDKSAPALLLLLLFLGVLLMIPKMVRWLQGRNLVPGQAHDLKVVSALSVGAQHRVVVVSLGSAMNHTHLVLGVSPQSITCLHAIDASGHLHPQIREVAK